MAVAAGSRGDGRGQKVQARELGEPELEEAEICVEPNLRYWVLVAGRPPQSFQALKES